MHEFFDERSRAYRRIPDAARPRILYVQPVLRVKIRDPSLELEIPMINLQVVACVRNPIVMRILRSLKGPEQCYRARA